MKKNITRIIVALVGLGILGGGSAWFIASGKAVTQAEALVAKLNAQTLPQNGTVKLSYERLSRSGFPAVGVRMLNPVLSATIPGDAEGRPPIDITWKRTGHVDIITNYLTHSYQILSNGTGELRVTSGNENITTTSDFSQVALHITAKDGAAFTRWSELNLNDFAAIHAATKDIAEFSFSASPLVIKETANNATIYTQGASHVDIKNRTTEGTINFDLDSTLNGMEITKEYGPVMQRLVRALQMPEAVWNEASPFSSTRAGKQDFIITMQVNMPDKPGPVPNGYIRIPKFHIKNAYYSLDMPLQVTFKEEDDLRLASVKLDAAWNVTQAGAQEMQAALDMMTDKDKFGGLFLKMAGATKTEIDQHALKQKMTEALPSLSTIGPITFVADFEVSAPKTPRSPLDIKRDASAINAENLTIRALNFNHTRWGVDVKGMAARAAGSAPTVDMTIICKRCDTMTKDIYDTASAAQSAMNMMTPERAQWPISEALLTTINTTLADIGRKDEAGDITFGINSPKAGDYRVNDKPMEEVLPKLMMVFAPLAAQHVPASGITAPPVVQ